MKGNEGLLIPLNSRWKWKFTHAGGTKTSVEPPIRLIYGRFEGLIFAKWLIYGTQIAISQVWGAELQRSYSQYSGFGAIYKPLSETRTPNLPYISEIALNNVPFVPDTTPTAAPQHPTILFPICSPPDARHPTGFCTHIPHQPLRTFSRIGQNLAILSEMGKRAAPYLQNQTKIQPNTCPKNGKAEEEHRSTPPRLPRNQTETEDLLSENEEEEEEDARPPRNRTETGGFCLKTGKERPCQP